MPIDNSPDIKGNTQTARSYVISKLQDQKLLSNLSCCLISSKTQESVIKNVIHPVSTNCNAKWDVCQKK